MAKTISFIDEMHEKLQAVLSKPFLLVQIGDYGQGYETIPIPPGLVPVALERQQRGEPTYPINPDLPPPHFCVPSDVDGILMNKTDELRINSFAYWAQKLETRVNKRSCINSSPDELLRFSNMVNCFWAVLVKKRATVAPQGNRPGRVFKRRILGGGYLPEPPTDEVNMDVVYTEAGRATLIFQSLETLRTPEEINLNEFYVFFTPSGGLPDDAQLQGMRLPYRPSMYGTCSILMKGRPDEETGIHPLRSENARCLVVALASVHKHVCGRVLP